MHHTDIVLFKAHQHHMIYVSRFLRWFLPGVILILIMWRFIFIDSLYITHIIWIIIWTALLYIYENHLWKNSYILVTNQGLSKKIRRGFFGNDIMSINFDSVRDVAIEKTNVLHFISGCGTLYARSSSGAQSDFKSTWTPAVDDVFKKVNFLNNLSHEERESIKTHDDLVEKMQETIQDNRKEVQEAQSDSLEDNVKIITEEAKTLKDKEGIQEIILLNDEDRLQVFENEEAKNHWVHEVIKRDVVYAVIHDDNFSIDNQNEVIRIWEKEIYPTLEFDELNTDKAIAGYPGIEVQTYLSGRFVKTVKTDKILLIWFDT